MNTDFRFDLDSDVDLAENQSQPPWELSGYSQAVADEHLQRRTTSVDHKISQARLKRRPVGKGAPHDENGREEDEQPTHARKKGGRKGLGAQKRRGGSSLRGRDGAEEEDEDADDQSGSGSDDALEEDLQIPEAGQWADDSDSNGDEGPKGDLRKVGHFEDVEDGGETEEEDDDDSEDGESGLEEEEYGKKVISADTTKPEKASRKIRMPFQDAKIQDDGKNDKKVPEFFSSAEGATFSARNFVELNISRPLVRACESLGYKQPTPIQAACIPLALTGRDICGSAVTGSGKTAAFALPLLERLLFRPRRIHAIRVLILTPTRELAVQVHSMIEKLAQFTDIRCCLVVGGLSIKAQEVALRAHPDIVVATPGRMIDHLHNTQSVGLEDLAILILDEADRLLELGFSQEVHELVRLCPKRRQTMLFSATMTEEVDELIKLSLTNPVRLSADPSTQRPSTLLEEVIKVRPQHEADKEAVLLAICSRSFTSKTIIFSGTKVEAHRLKILFGLSGLTAAELHGNLTQTQRLQALELFRKNEVDFLVATDVAARGLDIIGVETVVNFECPHDITMYVHRVGRTARAGQRGCAVTFVTDKDRSLLKSVAKRAGSKLQNRVVASAAITMWREKIEEMEDDIRGIMREEKEERALRKAEMEANKAQNLMEHEAEIFARPKKTWFQTPKEKRLIAKSAKAAKDGTENDGNARKVLSVEEAEDLRKKEKRRLEQEKNMTRKKRRRLEAAREVAEEDNQENDEQIDDRLLEKRSGKKALKKEGSSVVDLAYRRAKSAKAAEKARLSGKTMHKRKDADKMRSKSSRSKNRREEMQELFQGDLGEAKRHKGLFGKGFSVTAKRRKPSVSKKSFKSKSRYKRR